MGITTEQFFENIYNVIFSPKTFFENENMTVSVRLAIGTVIFVSVFTTVMSSVFDGSIINLSFFFKLFSAIIFSLLLWFLTALFFEYVAKIFSKNGNLSKILFYTAFAPIPYIFFAPLSLVKNSGDVGYVFGSISLFILYIWIITLYVYSIKAVYKISFARSFMLIFLPIISVFFSIYWSVCFFSKLGDIFSI